VFWLAEVPFFDVRRQRIWSSGAVSCTLPIAGRRSVTACGCSTPRCRQPMAPQPTSPGPGPIPPPRSRRRAARKLGGALDARRRLAP
jgi:hypothetical protein